MSDTRFAAASLVLGVAFLARVAGQAAQRWWGLGFLPPQESWQGSNLPFPVLLTAQVAILAIIAVATLRMRLGRDLFARHWVRPVRWLGVVYFVTMAARLVVGLAGDAGVLGDDSFAAQKWFTAYLPTSFHLVLALEVVVFAAYQRSRLGLTDVALAEVGVMADPR